MQKRRPLRLINKNLQLKFATIITVVISINTIVVTTISWLVMKYNYNSIIDSVGYIVPDLSRNLQMEQFTMLSLLIFIAGLSIILSFVLGIWLSGKIAGPLFAFTRAVNRLTKGFDEGFKLRQNDDLKDLEILYDEIRGLVKK